MNRRLIAFMTVVLVVGLISTANAGWGVGGFGGVSVPIVQDDAENGTVFGGRLKLSVGGLLGVEPTVMFFTNGDWTMDGVEGITFKGAEYNSVGVNLLLGGAGPVKAFRMFGVAGVNYYSQDMDFEHGDDSNVGWNAGLGLEFGAGNIGIEGRGTFNLMKLEAGGSRKWAQITGGVNIYFGGP